MPELMPRLPSNTLSGAKVFRPCSIAGKTRLRGEIISEDDLLKIKPSNLRSLVDQRFLQVFVRGPETIQPPADPGEVITAPRLGAANRFDVIVGRRVNAGPLTRSEADELAKRIQDREAT